MNEHKYVTTLCVLCGEEAITTAAQIPVCKKHYDEYTKEGERYLPNNERVFYKKLLSAAETSK